MSDNEHLTLDQQTTQDLCEVIITAPDRDWLAHFVRGLIVDRLCAGSHLTEVRSLYPWRGAVQDTSEARVAIRTRIALVPEIITRVRAVHPYEVPSVVALPLIAANPDYAAWIRENTHPATKSGPSPT